MTDHIILANGEGDSLGNYNIEIQRVLREGVAKWDDGPNNTGKIGYYFGFQKKDDRQKLYLELYKIIGFGEREAHWDDMVFSLVEQTGKLKIEVTLNSNYNSSQMINALATGLTASSADRGNSLTYSVAYDSGKFTITSTGNFIVSKDKKNVANTSLGFMSPSKSFATAQTSDSVTKSVQKRNRQCLVLRPLGMTMDWTKYNELNKYEWKEDQPLQGTNRFKWTNPL